MTGILSGLSSLGLGKLEKMNIYEEPEKNSRTVGTGSKPKIVKLQENEMIYDRTYQCPVCDSKIIAKTMKTGKAKLLGTDLDLRPKYEGIDALKYDVIMCPHCGFATLTRYFATPTPTQIRMIRENISQNVKMKPSTDDIYSYETAMQRYQLALVNAVVKHAKASEKAYICLKTGWMLRGWQESLKPGEEGYAKKKEELAAEEKDALKKALEGFIAARQSENFPMCGMDETTVDYLLSALAIGFQQYELASKMIASILTSPSANNRMKDKARDLKEMVLEGKKKKKDE